MSPIKLNIGAGSTQIDGWIPIDRKLGHEALPLPAKVNNNGQEVALDDNSVDEIRASHILEHFSFADARRALADWVRVLKPGGRIRLAVPDIDKVLASADSRRLFWLMGGQTDADDFHRSAFDESRLRAFMEDVGIENIQRWESQNTDCASLPVSLNLEGTKREGASLPLDTREATVRLLAFMTVPRYISASTRVLIEAALKPLNITLVQSEGVFYGQCMQRMLEDAIADGLDWILTIDSDSVFTTEHLSILFDEFAKHPEADAMAALQCRRGKPFPLLTIPEKSQEKEVQVDGSPILVATAHFGLTLLRVSELKEVAKPWFKSEPDKDGGWGDDRLDDDIWFWHQWRLAGKTIYVTPRSSIGHMEEMIAMFDEKMQTCYLHMADWKQKFLDSRHQGLGASK